MFNITESLEINLHYMQAIETRCQLLDHFFLSFDYSEVQLNS